MKYVGKIVQLVWVRLLIAGLIVFVFAMGSKVAYKAITYQQNTVQIAELNRQTLHRAELAIDYAVITLTDLAASGLARCDPESLTEIRRIIYLRGAVKDVQVLGADNQLLCAGLPQARSLGIANFDLRDGYAASSGNIVFYNMGLGASSLLGVAWQIRSDLTLLAVLNVDSLMFDVFPAALREHSRADLLLGEDQSFARYITFSETEMPIEDPILFSTQSERYPLQARFRLSASALGDWNRSAEPYVLEFGFVLGVIVAGLVVGLLSRPADPRAEIREALRRDEFVPFLQPIFAIDGRRIVGCEALMRWVKADGSVVMPVSFIALAEESGLIVPMTRSIIRTALRGLSAQMKRDGDFKVAFNIVSNDLVSSGFADAMCNIARETGVARRQIVLELTERQEFEDTARAIAAIKSLRELGFRVALDDTGTGHNGLANVHDLGVDIIKIDKHFTDLIDVDRAATTITQMLVRLAKDLGMTTVAEGVETEQQLDALRDCGVDEGQGFLVSPAVPVDAFLKMVAKGEQAKAARRAA